MIIGHGDIASALEKLPSITLNDDWIFFASGVSTSQETKESEYKREEQLLLSQDKNKHIVYFGSLCVFYSQGRYARHKMHMEALIKKHFKHYTILRLGNITWGDNPRTIINFLKNRHKSGKPLEIRNVYRYIINRNEFLHWIKMIPPWSCEMNITGERLRVSQIVKKYVDKHKG